MPKSGYLTIVILAGLLSTTWLTNGILARQPDFIYLPLALRFLFGAATLFFLPLIFLKRLPQSSLRLLHAALSVSSLTYFLAPLLLQMSLATLPSGFVGLAFCTIPIWLTIVVKGFSSEKFADYFLVILGLVVAMVGCWTIAADRGNPLMALLFLTLACTFQVFGIWLSRRLFWLHSALDLNFWAMVLAGLAHLLLSLIQGEVVSARFYLLRPEVAVLILWTGFIGTGVSAYLYRVESMTRNTLVLLTLLVPALSLILGSLALEETPLNIFTGSGLLMVLFVLGKESLRGIPAYWMTLLLNNDRRHGDRLVCLLDGYLKRPGDTQPARVQVINLSIGGIGFRMDRELPAGERIILTLPMGQNWTSFTLEGRIAHIEKRGVKDFPFSGGIEFQNLAGFRLQCVVEFLARVSRAEDESVGMFQNQE